MKKSLRQLVLECVVERGQASITEVLGVVGRNISSSSAQRYVEWQRRLTRRRHYVDGSRSGKLRKDQGEVGRRMSIMYTLGRLCREGKIRRVAVGVYAKNGGDE